MRRFWLGVFFFILSVANLVPCQAGGGAGLDTAAGLWASVEPSQVPVGGVALLRLRYRLPEGATLEGGGAVGGLGGVTVLERKAIPGEIHLKILVARLGTWVTGPLTLSYRDREGKPQTLEAAPPKLLVLSNLGERPGDARLKPIREILPSAPWWRRQGPWIAVALGLAVTVTAVLLWYRRRPPRLQGEALAPAHETALALLEALEREDLCGSGLYKEHYYRLSEILKRYMESLRGFPAAEYTTEEIQARAKEPEDLELVQLLRRADLVKFADRMPDRAEREGDLAAARGYVRETMPTPNGQEAVDQPHGGTS